MQQKITNIISGAPMLRQAVAADLPELTKLMEQSVRLLNGQDYSPQQVESALDHILGIDRQLIDDGTYYVAEIEGEIAGCGGWSRNSALYEGSRVQLSTAAHTMAAGDEAAKIRAMFVHPRFARLGVGTQLMQICELAARRAGFKRLELIATLTGEPFYRKLGFMVIDTIDLVMPNGMSLQASKMAKQL